MENWSCLCSSFPSGSFSDVSSHVSAGHHSNGLQAANSHSEGLCSCRPAGERPVCLRCYWDRWNWYTGIKSLYCSPVKILEPDRVMKGFLSPGKTAAFMLPVLERLVYKPRTSQVTRVLVLVPTRELGIQVHSVARQLAQFTSITTCLAVGMKVYWPTRTQLHFSFYCLCLKSCKNWTLSDPGLWFLCPGGLDLKSQEAALRAGPDVLIATPGRLIDHLHNTPSFELTHIEILILDEADR